MRTALLGACLLTLIIPVLIAGEGTLTHKDVFTAGSDGYHTFRIPALVTSPSGALIALAEARKENRHDPGGGDIDLVYKRSTDGGTTWSQLMLLDDPGVGWAASNPTPVVDRDQGRIWVLFNRWEPGHGTFSSQIGTRNNQTWAYHSEDDGIGWSAPIDLTAASREIDHWGAIFLGYGAIQTRSGRLIVPAARKPDVLHVQGAVGEYSGPVRIMRAYVLYSDDHGTTWQRSELVRALTDENQVVELADGAIMMDARQGAGPHRWLTISSDGGSSWSNPLPGQQVTPVATSIERFTLKAAGDDRNRILWTGPAGPGRKSLVVRISYDEGQTFRRQKLIYGGLSAYSDLSILKDKSVGVLWERGVSQSYQYITFSRFNLDFLE